MTNRFVRYQQALLWQGDTTPTEAMARQALREQGGLFARWTSHHDCPQPTAWWYCIKEQFTPLDSYSAKQRYRIRRGLQNCRILPLTTEQLHPYHEAIYSLLCESFADYPAAYRPNYTRSEFLEQLGQMKANHADCFLAFTADNELCAFCYCEVVDGVAWLRQVKVPTRLLPTEVNAALAFTVTRFYLEQQRVRYICDGERNIRHATAYQDFLVRVIGFRYAYCRLHVVYAAWLKPLVSVLYPFRSLFERLGQRSKLCFNISSLLQQHTIVKSFY